MKTEVVGYVAEEGGYWAEVVSMPGCCTQGDTIPELVSNLQEAMEGWLSVLAEDTKNQLQQGIYICL